MQISSGEGHSSDLDGEQVDGIHGKQTVMETAETTTPLDEVFPKRALGLCPERGPILPEGWLRHHGIWVLGWSQGRLFLQRW